MAELADAHDSGSVGQPMQVQVLLSAPKANKPHSYAVCFLYVHVFYTIFLNLHDFI